MTYERGSLGNQITSFSLYVKIKLTTTSQISVSFFLGHAVYKLFYSNYRKTVLNKRFTTFYKKIN